MLRDMFTLPGKHAALALTIIFAALTVLVLAAGLPYLCATTCGGCALLYGAVWYVKSGRDRRLLLQARQSREDARTLAARTPPAKSSPDSSSFDFE